MADSRLITRRLFLKSVPPALIVGTVATASVEAKAVPEERIAAAMAEIQSALKEMYPSWSWQEPRSDVQHAYRIEQGERLKGDPYSHAILFYAYDGMHGSQKASWMRHYR